VSEPLILLIVSLNVALGFRSLLPGVVNAPAAA
jgi:hypothetical protein